jgi:hypothetical protein
MVRFCLTLANTTGGEETEFLELKLGAWNEEHTKI